MLNSRVDIIFQAMDELTGITLCDNEPEKESVINLIKGILADYPSKTRNPNDKKAKEHISNAVKMLDTSIDDCMKLHFDVFVSLENALSDLLAD